MFADVYGCAVKLPSNEDGAALGAALLAAQAVGTEIRVFCDERKYAPIDSAAYEPYYQLYTALYGSLKSGFEALAAV
jgi:xylulokinase